MGPNVGHLDLDVDLEVDLDLDLDLDLDEEGDADEEVAGEGGWCDCALMRNSKVSKTREEFSILPSSL